jgi:uncharacterized protein with NAD-binding domain and iron-sulfur cluster
LAEAGAATAAGADLLTKPALAVPRRRTPGRRPAVAVFGGGIAGLTAAHELAERGFDVTLYERRAWGGKARSYDIPGTAAGGRKPLPGEHGFRVFFGFYQNTIDTFRRIPFGSNPNGVFDNLTSCTNLLFARDGDRRDLLLPLGGLSTRPLPTSPGAVVDTVVSLLLRETYLQPEAVAFLGQRLAVWLSSCQARRVGEWENVRWTDFAGANRFNADYRRIIVTAFSETVQAAKAENTSASFPMHVLEWIVYNLLGRYSNGPTFRMLDRPSNEALIYPWLSVLRSLRVRLRLGCEVTGFSVRHGRIAGAHIRDAHGTRTVHADWYVCALPVERARRLWSSHVLRADPALARMNALSTGWMNGVKFFLREKTPIVNGILNCVDAPWLIAGLSQAQFWPLDFAATYGDGSVRDCISVVVSKWTAPGVLYGKPATQCTPDEVANEVWEQIKRHVNNTGKAVLTDELLHSWDIDNGMLRIRRHGHLLSDDPLVLPAVGERAQRPDVTTKIPNLLLCGDYLHGNWEVANMECASYNARRAVNALLAQAGSNEAVCAAIEIASPPEWEPLKRIDERRYRAGQPNLLDTDVRSPEVMQLLGS